MSAFTVCIFIAFLCLAHDGAVSGKGGSDLASILDHGTLMSLALGVCKSLKRMGLRASLHNSGSDMDLGYMAWCCGPDVDWLWGTWSWFP